MVVRCGFFVVWFFILPLLSMRALNSQRFSFSACSAMVYLRALQITTFNAPFFRRLCHKFESIFIARYSGIFYVSAFFFLLSLSLCLSSSRHNISAYNHWLYRCIPSPFVQLYYILFCQTIAIVEPLTLFRSVEFILKCYGTKKCAHFWTASN